MRIYVTNLRSEVTDDDLRKLFETCGKIAVAEIIKTFTTNESTGLGYVEMESPDDAMAVRKELNGKLLKGNPINIFDRRITANRREGTNRRGPDGRRNLAEKRHMERRQKSGEAELLSMFNELDRREIEERRISERRDLDERRMGERRIGLNRRQLSA